MKKDYVFIDVISNPKLHFLFECLKTSNWRKLNETGKENFYMKLNKAVCGALKIEEIDLVVGDGELNENSFLPNSDYKNLIIDYDQRPCINDVNYNQYLTLYEYFFRVRMYLLYLTSEGKYNAFFDEDKMNNIRNNYKSEKMGGIHLHIDKEDMESYEDYQYVNREARGFAESILFKIVKDNYDFNDGHDEEEFMANYNVLVSSFVNDIGEFYLNGHILNMNKAIFKLSKIKNKINQLDKANLSSIKDEDLLFMVYPSIIHNSDPVIVINTFNEIIKRIYNDVFKITWKKGFLVINNHSYSINDIDNLFNIVLYECLNDMNKNLKDELSENDLVCYKKKWLLSVIRMVDSSVDVEDFGIFKYQSIYRLLNKEMMDNIVNNLDCNYFPLMKRGNR